MEEEILKQLTKQGGNEILEIRTGVRILQKQVNTGILIGKVSDSSVAHPMTNTEPTAPDEDQAEEL
jgi:hypothetical protein